MCYMRSPANITKVRSFVPIKDEKQFEPAAKSRVLFEELVGED